jgi:hypothetical protein
VLKEGGGPLGPFFFGFDVHDTSISAAIVSDRSLLTSLRPIT